MIRLSGLREKPSQSPEGDIEIQAIGLRPGEKLAEELRISADAVLTLHPQMLMAQEDFLKEEIFDAELKQLENVISSGEQQELDPLLKRTERLPDSASS